jgi:MFS family permease
MKERVPLILGALAVMALSNAILPILPFFADEAPAIQGAIFSAYFLGAFLTVLPAGILSDRIGRLPLMRAGLALTLASGILIFLFPTAFPVIVARAIEGFGAGLFVPSALSWVNSQKDHVRLSGLFFAAMNFGLVTGLLGTGWLEMSAGPIGGIVFFTAFSAIPLLLSGLMKEKTPIPGQKSDLVHIFKDNFWLYVSSLVLLGATGVVSAMYPEFTDQAPVLLSYQIGTMNVATIVSSLAAPRLKLQPIPVIQIGSLAMGIAVMASFFAPVLGFGAIIASFAVLGGVTGFVVVAQMAYLAETGYPQGAIMGIFTTATYAGMTFLPALAGAIAEVVDFFTAFFITALITLSVAATIGRCRCVRTEA